MRLMLETSLTDVNSNFKLDLNFEAIFNLYSTLGMNELNYLILVIVSF